MKNRKLGLVFSILGFIVALIGIYLEDPEYSFPILCLLKYGGVILLMLGAIINYLATSAFTFEFNSRSWEKDGNEIVLYIPHSIHKKTNPRSKVFEKVGETYQEIIIVILNNGNDVQIRAAGSTFNGKVIIE